MIWEQPSNGCNNLDVLEEYFRTPINLIDGCPEITDHGCPEIISRNHHPN